jgi:hypothetical protein
MVIFTRTFDLLTWLLPATNHFPRAHRYSYTSRLMGAAFGFSEALLDAQQTRGNARRAALTRAAAELDKVRLYLRFLYFLCQRKYQRKA